ncbi:MAG: SWIM zinc finger family protein [Chlamydiae bacterium]|nr:SWIM zinc finger family protein [Chlamydiota bacterium]
MSYWGFPRYVSAVVLKGSALARTWWGKAWNHNLEAYADYSNRIGRGRSYVRHGAVLDLRIEPGEVIALVQGSERVPYSVSVKIQTLKKETWHRMKTACEGTLESFQELLTGNFPRALGDILINKDSGMFPAPREIKFDCSCPDWADMCKHVAAVLYGVGVRLDEDPKLFFRLRDAGIDKLIKQAVAGKTEKLLEKAGRKSGRVIEDTDLSSVFGVNIEEPVARGKNKMIKAQATRKKNKAEEASAKLKLSVRPQQKRLKRRKKSAKVLESA